MVRSTVRYIAVLVVALGVFLLAWRLAERFFHAPHDVSLAIASLVAGFTLTVLGRWATREEKVDESAADGGNLNASSSGQVFRRMFSDLNFGPSNDVNVPVTEAGVAQRRIALVMIFLVVALFLTLRFRAPSAVTSPRPAAAPANSAEPTLRDGAVSEIASSETGLCAEVRNLEHVENATIDQGTCGGGLNQKFKAVAGVDPGTFKLQAIHSGKCMTVTDDRRVVQVNCPDSTQFWRFRWRDTKRGWHYWEIRNTAYGGGLCLDLPGFSHKPDAPLQVSECNKGNNQQWRTRA